MLVGRLGEPSKQKRMQRSPRAVAMFRANMTCPASKQEEMPRNIGTQTRAFR
jgi:hypothetical protein